MTSPLWLARSRERLVRPLGIVSRAIAAIGGGYAVAAAAAAVIALYLPGSRANAAVTGTLMSFLIYAVAVMWVFAARTATRAWIGLVIPGAVLASVLFLHYGVGGAAT
ncbi:MAG: DUF3649 domain-containing protein [Rhizobacter sp.]